MFSVLSGSYDPEENFCLSIIIILAGILLCSIDTIITTTTEHLTDNLTPFPNIFKFKAIAIVPKEEKSTYLFYKTIFMWKKVYLTWKRYLQHSYLQHAVAVPPVVLNLMSSGTSYHWMS